MIREALDDAGLTIDDVDGVFTQHVAGWAPSLELAEYLGIAPRWTDSTKTGGSSFEIHVEHAAAAIALGLCDVAVIVYAATPQSIVQAGRRRVAASRQTMPGATPDGGVGAALRHAHADGRVRAGRQPAHGTSSAPRPSSSPRSRSTPASGRRMNPRARLQDPITIDDVLASPMEASPLHKLDCCLVTDGAGAVVLTSAERARDLRQAAGAACSAPAPATPTP